SVTLAPVPPARPPAIGRRREAAAGHLWHIRLRRGRAGPPAPHLSLGRDAMSPHTYPPAAPQSGGRRAPLKPVPLLLQAPDSQVLDARVRAVTAREVGLILDRRLAVGLIV